MNLSEHLPNLAENQMREAQGRNQLAAKLGIITNGMRSEKNFMVRSNITLFSFASSQLRQILSARIVPK